MDKKLIALGAKCELARRRFFYYAQLRNPKFYKADREYLVQLCDALEDFIKSDKRLLMLNTPPRHGKTYTVLNYVEWLLGKNPELQIMLGSYNETLSTRSSKKIRNDIMETKGSLYKPVYSDVFPGIAIKRGDGAMNLWSLEGHNDNYLATSPAGTATGFGCQLMIIDDIIKNAEEAYNEDVKEKHWDWFTNTMLSRLEEGGKIILIMTRWASDDLAGKALNYFPAEQTVHINLKAVQDDGSMLCAEVLSAESCAEKKRLMGLDIWSANYQQEPIDLKGRLYSKFKTYSGELPQFKQIRSYTDTADEGSDFLCSIVYGVTFANEAYVLDVLYTDAPMEDTEPRTAAMLFNNSVNLAKIESNNGGRGFARAVRKQLADNYGSNQCIVKWFHQSKNKQARILSNSTWVMEHIYFPENWKDRWPEYYDAMTRYQRQGKNKHDDAPDATTGIAEDLAGNGGMRILK